MRGHRRASAWRVVMHVLACAVAALAVATVGAAAASASASAPASVGLRSRALHAAPPTRAPVAVAIEHHRVEVETTPLMWCDEEACTGALARVQETFTLVTTCRVVASRTPTDSGVRAASGDAGVTTRTVLCPGRRRCSLGGSGYCPCVGTVYYCVGTGNTSVLSCPPSAS